MHDHNKLKPVYFIPENFICDYIIEVISIHKMKPFKFKL